MRTVRVLWFLTVCLALGVYFGLDQRVPFGWIAMGAMVVMGAEAFIFARDDGTADWYRNDPPPED